MVIEYLSNNLLFGNTLLRICSAIAIFFGINALLYLTKEVILSRFAKFAEKTETDADDKIIHTLSSLPSFVYAILGGWAAITQLIVPFWVTRFFDVAILIVAAYVAIKIISILIDVYAVIKSADLSEQQQSMSRLLARIAKMFLWVIAILLFLDNNGVKIGPLLAGLGIGGIAIAFAFQSVIEDLFAAFTIYFDKPFEVGDYIVLSGGDTGSVKHVGLRTTRVKTLQGQELVVSNRELTSTRLQNYKRMQKRRVVFGFGLEYGTTVTKLKKAKQIISDIFESIEDADLDRVHFKEFADSSLNYEVVYFMKSKDYTKYMDTQELVNLEITQRFKKAGLSMAFPTQTLHIKK